MKTLHALCLLLLTSAPFASPAAAQNLYGLGGVEFDAIPGSASGTLLGYDDRGWAYHGGVAYETRLPLTCYRPDRPEVAPTLVTVDKQHVFYSAMMHDHSGVFLMGSAPAQMGVLTCDATAEAGFRWDAVEPTGAFPDLAATEGENDAATLVMSPAGDPCFVTWEGLWCGTLDARAGTIAFELLIDLRTMDDLLDPDPGWGQEVLDTHGGRETTHRWRIREVFWAPDERLFAVIDIRFRGYSWDNDPLVTDWLGYLIEITGGDDGALQVLVRPPRPPKPGLVWEPGDAHAVVADPLADAEALVYSAELDALLAWPLRLWDWDSSYISLPGTGEHGPKGPDGVGFYAVPLAGDTRDVPTYLSLTDSLIHFDPYSLYNLRGAVQLPDGGVAIAVSSAAGSALRLRFALDQLDIDTDGLSHADEQALGSSDYTPQSDFSTTADSIEVMLGGSDPTDRTDDPAPARVERFAYVRSGLIRKHLQENGLLEDVMTKAVKGRSINGPLCFREDDAVECVFRDRSSRIRFPATTGQLGGENVPFDLRMSQAGDHAVFLAHDGIRRISFPEGGQELVVDAGTLETLLPDDADKLARMQLFPVSPELLFFSVGWDVPDPTWVTDELFVYAAKRGNAPRLVYDHQQARQDSAMGPWDPQFGDGAAPFPPRANGATPKAPNDFLPGSARVAGWFPELDRLLLVVAARWSRYYVALHHEEPPTRLLGQKYFQGWHSLLGLPAFVMPTGFGELFVGWGFLDGWLANPYQFEADGLIGEQPPVACWGDLLLDIDASIPPAVWEYVRYDGWGDPGDVLFLDSFVDSDRLGFYHMMTRSGPRGGMAQAWSRGVVLNNPWGMDVRDDGLLCLVDRGERNDKSYGEAAVHVMAPSTPQRVADVSLLTIAGFPDATDCHFADDDSLFILVTEPPQLVRYQMWTEDWEVVEELPSNSEPLDLVEKPGGGVEVLLEGRGLRGFLYLRDGRRLEMGDDTFVATVDGTPVADLSQLLGGDGGDPPPPNTTAHVRFVERPDGLVVAAPFACHEEVVARGRLLVFDPDTTLDGLDGPGCWPLSAHATLYTKEGSPLAVMPGEYEDPESDPWGQPGGGGSSSTDGLVLPGTPRAPTGGEPLLEGGRTTSAGCHVASLHGCTGAGSWLALFLFGLALLIAVRVRAARADTAIRP